MFLIDYDGIDSNCSRSSISKDLPKHSSPNTSVAMKVNRFRISLLPTRASRLIFWTASSVFDLTAASHPSNDELEKLRAKSRRRWACCLGSIMANIPGGLSMTRLVYQSALLKPDPMRWIVPIASMSVTEISFSAIRTKSLGLGQNSFQSLQAILY